MYEDILMKFKENKLMPKFSCSNDLLQSNVNGFILEVNNRLNNCYSNKQTREVFINANEFLFESIRQFYLFLIANDIFNIDSFRKYTNEFSEFIEITHNKKKQELEEK